MFEILAFLFQMFHRLSSLIFFCAQHGAHCFRLPLLHTVIRESPHSAEHGHTHAALVPLDAGQLDLSDLPGALHVGRAAGAAVVSRDHDDPHRALYLDLAAVFHPRQLIPRGIDCLNLQVLPDRTVRFQLDLRQLFRRDLPVEIHCTVFTSEMEAHIPVPEPAVDQP